MIRWFLTFLCCAVAGAALADNILLTGVGTFQAAAGPCSKILLNDGTSAILLNDGTSYLCLN